MRLLALLALLLLAGCSQAVPIPTFAPTGPPPVALPTRVEIPAIGASGDLLHLGLNPDGTLTVPDVTDPLTPSWYDRGPRPGQRGPAVLAGHVDGRVDGRSGQPGIFARLGELEPGDVVHVDRADGTRATFEVTGVESYPKDAFLTEAVYGDTAGAELRLITCSGEFDRAERSYKDNTVVFARLAS